MKRFMTYSRFDSQQVLSQLDAGSVQLRDPPFSVIAHISTSLHTVRTAIPIIFEISNKHREVIDLQITLETADYFMFAGNKKVN